MSESAEGSITSFINDLRAGEPAALRPLCQRYFPQLVGIARSTLGSSPIAAQGAEYAAQSAMISFWQGITAGNFELNLERNGLLKLLTVITKRKVYGQRERENALKRGGGRVRNVGGGSGDESGPRLEELADVLPTQELDLVCKEMIELLPDDLRPFAVLRLMGYRNREAAEQMNCTERKVERKLNLVRDAWSGNPEEE